MFIYFNSNISFIKNKRYILKCRLIEKQRINRDQKTVKKYANMGDFKPEQKTFETRTAKPWI